MQLLSVLCVAPRKTQNILLAAFKEKHQAGEDKVDNEVKFAIEDCDKFIEEERQSKSSEAQPTQDIFSFLDDLTTMMKSF